MTRKAARILFPPGLALVAALLTGCATAEKSTYARHISAVVHPGPAADDKLAIAFGLEGQPGEPALFAAASRSGLDPD